MAAAQVTTCSAVWLPTSGRGSRSPGPATLMAATTSPWWSRTGAATQRTSIALLLVGAIATAADRVQLREQRIDVRDGRGREARQAGDAVVRRDLLGRVEGPAGPCRGRCSGQVGPRRRGTSCT